MERFNNFDKINCRQIALDLLLDVETRGLFSDRLLSKIITKKNLNPKEIGFLKALVSGTLKKSRLFDWIIENYYGEKCSSLHPPIKNILRIALFELLELDNVSEKTTVYKAVELAKIYGHRGTAGLVNAILRNFLRNGKKIHLPSREKDKELYFSVYYSHPIWMVRKWIHRFGYENTEKLLQRNNEFPPVSLRPNLLLTNTEHLTEKLEKAQQQVCLSKISKGNILVHGFKNIGNFPGFEDGEFFIQDEAASILGMLYNSDPGILALDMCSAPGGKGMFLAVRRLDKGLIYCLDRSLSRLLMLKENIQRLKLKSLKIIAGDGSSIVFSKKFDMIMIDAPCSGSGVLRRKPDLRWRITEKRVKALSEIQKSLLRNGASMLASGGMLIYTTCSLEREENYDIVENFLSEHHNFKLEQEKIKEIQEFTDEKGIVEIFPFKNLCDGGFGAVLRKIYD